MNVNPNFTSASTSTSIFKLSPNSANNNNNNNNSKPNILSSYLVSDEEDDNDLLADKTNGSTSADNQIQILATPQSMLSKSVSQSHLLDSTSQDLISNVNENIVERNSNINSLAKQTINVWSDDTIRSTTPRRSQYRITFEIIKAKTVTAYENDRNRFERKKFVNYTILIKRVPGLETKPAIIERRYSDFLNFYNLIKKRYPTLLRNVIFPKKIFLGNFSPEVIADRSLAFRNFLSYCLSAPEIRSSKEFASFLYYPELKEAKKCLCSIHLEEAASIFENVYFIQDKLSIHSGRPNGQLIHTMCCLIGCLNAVDNTSEAKRLTDKTFEILFENSVILTPNNISQNNDSVCEVNNLYESSELVFPLILLSLRLRWFSGLRKIALENKLEELCRKRCLPRNFDSQPTLLEMILKKEFSPLLEQ